MISWIRGNREARLALAVCAGLLAYKFIVELAWALREDGWFGQTGTVELLITTSAVILFGIAAVWLWRCRNGTGIWIRTHRGTIVLVAIGALFAAAKGGKVYTSTVASGADYYDARLAANRSALLFMSLYMAAVFGVTLVQKLARGRKTG